MARAIGVQKKIRVKKPGFCQKPGFSTPNDSEFLYLARADMVHATRGTLRSHFLQQASVVALLQISITIDLECITQVDLHKFTQNNGRKGAFGQDEVKDQCIITWLFNV